MFICITNIDSQTGVLCTEAPMRNGPALPAVKGFQFQWANKSIYPIDCDETGRYTETPLYYGTCDDDADTSLVGVVKVLTEDEFVAERRAEMYARPHYPSWVFNEDTVQWEAPVPYPESAEPWEYQWDEATMSWVETNAA